MADKAISGLSEESSALAASDLIQAVVSGVNKKVQLSNLEALRKLAIGPAATTENSVPQWDATTRLLKDGLVLATAVADPGVDTKLPTEQAARELANTLERWTPIATSKYTATPASTSTITMSDTSDFAIGMPVKYSDSGGPFYAICTAISANTNITIAGAPLDAGDALAALAVGQPEMVKLLDFFISSTYGDGAADLLDADLNRAWKNLGAVMYLVAFSCQHKTDDTGANQPKLNVKVDAVAVSTEDGGNGLQVATSWVDGSAVAIDTAQYDLQRGEALEIECTVAGSNGDAADLSVVLAFVLP